MNLQVWRKGGRAEFSCCRKVVAEMNRGAKELSVGEGGRLRFVVGQGEGAEGFPLAGSACRFFGILLGIAVQRLACKLGLEEPLMGLKGIVFLGGTAGDPGWGCQRGIAWDRGRG